MDSDRQSAAAAAPGARPAGPESAPIRRPLRRRILWTTAVPLVVALGVSLLAVERRLYRYLEDQAAADLDSAERALGARLRSGEEDLTLWSEIAADMPQVRALVTPSPDGPPPAGLGDGIASEIRRTAKVGFVQLLDARGSLLGASSDGRAPDAEGADLATALGGTTRSGSIVSRGCLYQVVSQPVFFGDEVLGVLRCGREVELDGESFESRAAGIEIQLHLMSTDALASTEAPSDAVRRHALVPSLLSDRPASLTLTRSLEGARALVTGVRWSLLSIGFVTVLLALGLANWLAERITRPLEQLVRASTQLARGDYETSVRCDTGDELGALATSFDSMRGSLQRQIRLMEELDQMKSDFLGLASHELRTPASILQGCTDLLVEEPPADLAPGAPRHGLLEALQRASRDLIRVVEQVTDMTLLDRRQITLGLVPMDLGEVVGEAGRRHQEEMTRRRLSFDLEIEPGALHALVSPERISQALDHILHNAIRFTPDGGRIVLRARASNEEVVCEVQDTGVGIPAEVQERIFDPLFEGRPLNHHRSGTTEFGSSGLGMGLAICQRIVKAHRGRIEVESSPGRGSTFRIALPRLRRFEPRLVQGGVPELRTHDRAA